MRERVTSALELVSVGAICVGVFLAFGVAGVLVAAGVLGLAGSWVASR